MENTSLPNILDFDKFGRGPRIGELFSLFITFECSTISNAVIQLSQEKQKPSLKSKGLKRFERNKFSKEEIEDT